MSIGIEFTSVPENSALKKWETTIETDLTFIEEDLKEPFEWKDFVARSEGSGPHAHVVTEAMGESILKMVVAARGYPHRGHVLDTAATKLLAHNGQYIDLTYIEIVDQLLIEFNELDDVPEKVLYLRVWRWCQDHKITYRTPNKLSKRDEPTIDRRCLGTIREVEKFVAEHKIKLEDVVNIDETGLRPLLIRLRTLHYKGAKDVPMASELASHIMITLFVLWCGSGEIDFCAVIKSTNSQSFWEKFHDIWFLRAHGSKMTSKDTYPDLLQVVLQGKSPPPRLLSDDIHGGHGGRDPDNALSQLDPPVERIRIQGGCTAELAPADQVQSNKELKADIRRKLRQKHFRTALRGDKILFEASLTRKGCNEVAKILTEVKTEWNNNPKKRQGVKRAFEQTIFPSRNVNKSKRLQHRLDECRRHEREPI